MTSPTRAKHKLSLRKRLFVKKSPKVGCVKDSQHAYEDYYTISRSVSPIDPFLALSAHNSDQSLGQASNHKIALAETCATNSNQNDLEHIHSNEYALKCCKTFFKFPRSKSLVDENGCNAGNNEENSCSPLDNSSNSVNDPAYPSDQPKHEVITKVSVSFPKKDEPKKYFEHSGSFEGATNNKAFVKRLSADHLIHTDIKPICRSSSPEDSDRSSSLDRKRRNYLYGRLASHSLLGAAELEHVFPEREVKIFVGTWNMNGHAPPRELADFIFPIQVKNVPDIFAIGTQESYSERNEWEITIQELLGPSHLLLHSCYLGTLHLVIFIRRDLIWFCSLPEDASLSVRPGTAFRTKGAVAISFALFGTSFLFVTAHLTAHQEKVKERVSDIKRIIRAIDLPKNLPCKNKNKDVTNNFDYVFWCGDLNFRLGEPRAAVLQWIGKTEFVIPVYPTPSLGTVEEEKLEAASRGGTKSQNLKKFPLPSHLPHGLLHADQLTAVLEDGAAFRDFKEAPITFLPTYKYDPGSQQFDTSSKQRAPAYTDRILFKSKSAAHSASSFPGLRRTSAAPPMTGLKCIAYNSVQSVCTSDHKPVWAEFSAVLRPGTDVVPLAAGLFNREVYLEGIKRRRALLDHAPGTSAICSVQ